MPLPRIDWWQPWLAALRSVGEAAAADVAGGASVAEALDRAAPADFPRRFVPQAALGAGVAYEIFIAETGCVPTRDNLHDFFNGLVWLQHPALKLQLNVWQAAELGRRGSSGPRGALRDALTLFDESGAVLDAPAPLVEALRRRDWRELFLRLRPRWAEARLEIVGHALLEQLATAPRKPLVAFVVAANPLDLSEADWAAKPFLPLPVLGVPGWWPDNEEPDFYADDAVFRPARRP